MTQTQQKQGFSRVSKWNRFQFRKNFTTNDINMLENENPCF